jgi:hypothetical protein
VIELEIFGWSFLAAVAAWAITLRLALTAMARCRSELEEQLLHWKAEATRARELAAQLKQDVAMWSKGCQQGREDVINILPLLVATQQRATDAHTIYMTEADC